ncbi:DUF4031 domain containing protein [Lysobacter dokdonensis DS-58]|uniref:DUF4031 domain containing protein n=2 Tax=Noviluteimonas TaxID=3382693 RepID=A0A0A2WKG2_9GAMM|nr:DUF4031 domain containing protein [Lysobacter dokdonensis DS-58]
MHADHPTRAYFGDTHVHTGWSVDAGTEGVVTTPEDAFRLARGDQVTSNTGRPVKLKRPLDWMAITDHSDGMGTISEVIARNPEMMADPVVKGWSDALRSGDEHRMHDAAMDLIRKQANDQTPEIMKDAKWMASAWMRTIAIADKYNAPGKFTAFIGYEWTVNANGGNNLHRNIIYRDNADKAKQMLPLTTFQSQDPETLWAWMDEYERKTGGKLLAIPHNGNLSNGRMFEEQRFDGRPLTREYAQTRARWERLYELVQIKGQSESHPRLSPNDAYASWDLWDSGNLVGLPKQEGMLRTEYWREALKSGLRLEGTLGANPFKLGANAATDTHTGLATAEEDNFWGKFRGVEPTPTRWQPVVLGSGPSAKHGSDMVSAGYMGVWATANTREALWDAMQRRETFATTGTRMTLRFFGGFDFSADDVHDLVANGYAKGVPMGGDLDAPPQRGKSPTFLIAAMKDAEGANLDRVSVIKGWVDADGTTHEKVYDVKWSGDRTPDANGVLPAVGDTVDLKTATYKNTIGAPELVVAWTDPDFDPRVRAVYYVRALEIPTPRWTAYDVVRFGSKMPADVRMTLQERGFTSPIWYAPAVASR